MKVTDQKEFEYALFSNRKILKVMKLSSDKRFRLTAIIIDKFGRLALRMTRYISKFNF